MGIGVVFPQTEIASDVGAVRTYAQRVEELGFKHVMIYDYVIGADPDVHEGWEGYYDVGTTFHEPFVLFGYLAGVTSLELMTGIVILPQRQTVLVAKQAVEVDILSGGHLRLGIGLGWNSVEYGALGKSFTNRGERVEEQVVLLRKLWTERAITFHGEYEHVTGAGLAPLPIQCPIPVWFGANSTPAYRRAGRLGDGWIPDRMAPGPDLERAKAIVDAAAVEAGRDPTTRGMQGRIRWGNHGVADLGIDGVITMAERWRHYGASHLAINTMDAGLASVDDHLAVLERVASVLMLDADAT
jgi:probable F420-dependent oxidoreductase